MPTFTDVAATHAFYHEIEAVYAAGLMIGTQISPAVFSPDSNITNAQTLTTLARAVHYANPDITESDNADPQLYTDVAQGHWAYKWVQKAAKLGITAGQWIYDLTPGTIGEATATKRKWAAMFIVRALAESQLFSATARFTDVPTTYYLYGWIERAAALGITIGTGDGTTFSPEDNFTRGQMAAFLVRGFDVPYVTGPPGAPDIEE